MNIIKMHGSYNRSVRRGSIKYIVVHYTGTQASAKNNCAYFAGGDRQASADYFIDDNGIYEYNDPASGYYTWAVGDGGGKYGITNANSINIEVVSDGRDFSATEIAYLHELVRDLMERYGVSATNVVRHYDASRKQCPKPYVAAAKWQALWAQITTGASAQWLKDATGWWYRHADGSYTKSGWEKIDGYWYLFDSRGYMLTGWQKVAGVWYYLFEDGYMASNGWLWIGGRCYCFEASGAMRTGWIKDGGEWYFCDADGAMVRNRWIQDGSEWYYLLNDGHMARSMWVGDYWVNEHGVWTMSA